MNKIKKSITTILCAVLMLMGFTACGKTAYDVAVRNGYRGTEEEWLLTLQGSDGKDGSDLSAKELYEEAVAEGYEGTYLEFCKDVLSFDLQEDNDVDTIAQNITSVVSIYAGFSKTTQANIGGIMGGIIGSKPQTTYYSSAGSGVIIDLNKETGDALVVTNYHVIYDNNSSIKTGISDAIYLYTYGSFYAFDPEKDATQQGDGIKATYVGGAMDYDIAILRVTGSEYLKTHLVSKATFADSDDVQVGEKVFAIGNPDGAGIAVTEGIVSVESEYITMGATDGSNTTTDYRVLRTDAAINSGNSGGALFNTAGELIGITNAKNASSEVDNMGYALPATPVKNLTKNILRNAELYGDGSVRVATLGVMVEIKSSTSYFDEYGRLKIKEEFRVYEATAAPAKGKLQVGDTIKGIRIADGEWLEFTRRYQLIDSLLSVAKGDKVELKLVDSNAIEKTVEFIFDNDNYFTRYY